MTGRGGCTIGQEHEGAGAGVGDGEGREKSEASQPKPVLHLGFDDFVVNAAGGGFGDDLVVRGQDDVELHTGSWRYLL